MVSAKIDPNYARIHTPCRRSGHAKPTDSNKSIQKFSPGQRRMCSWSASLFKLLRRVSNRMATTLLISVYATSALAYIDVSKDLISPAVAAKLRNKAISTLTQTEVVWAKPHSAKCVSECCEDAWRLGEETGRNDYKLENSTWQRISRSHSRTYIRTSYFFSQTRLSSRITVYSIFLYQIHLISASHCRSPRCASSPSFF